MTDDRVPPPVPSHPTYPGRMVDTNSRVAALLRHAGLIATDVPGEGPLVSMVEAEAEIARRGIVVDLPDPKPPMHPDAARGYVRKMIAMGARLMRLSKGSKRPVENAWQHAPALTEDEATDWLVRGENIGINLLRSGPNGWLVLDAENAAATAALKAAGFFPTALTANAQDRTSEKYGGSHVWLPLPAGVDATALRSTLQLQLDGGGVLDVLVGTRYVVAPGTALDSAPGLRYAFAVGGAAVDDSKWVDAPAWLLDSSTPLPGNGIEALHGIAGPRRLVKRTARPDADRVTAQVDEIDWESWIDGDPRVQILGYDGSCGCDVFHWQGASTQRSGILHEGCAWGYGVHAFSGTLISQLGCDHMSRLQFAAFLRGRSEDLTALAREFGIAMGSRPTGFTAADIEQMTGIPTTPDLRIVPNSSDDTDPVTAAPVTAAPPKLSSVPKIGNAIGLPITDGATALAPEPVEDDTDEDTVEVEEDTGLAMFRRLAEIDASGFWESLPILRRVARAADSHGVGRWGLLGAVLPRIVCSVPPNVRLVGASGEEGGQNSGASLNLNSILTGPPEEGKSEVIKLGKDLVPLPEHAAEVTTGTGEGIVKSFSYTKKVSEKSKDAVPESEIPAGEGASPSLIPNVGSVGTPKHNAGYETVHITDTVMLTAGEISGMIAEMRRQGTKATGVYRSAWMGEELGTTAGEVERRTYLAPHTYRFGAVLGGQIDRDTLGAIFDEGKLGSPQRFLFLPVQTVDPCGEPVRSLEIPHIDWFDGHAPAAAVAGLVAPHPPVFIHRPPAAEAEIRASRAARKAREHVAYSVAEVHRRADDEDSIDDIKGHELLHQLKIATALAIGDGLKAATDEYWHAAGSVMQVRELGQGTLAKVFRAQRDVADRKRGRSQGKSQAEARYAEAEAKHDRLVEVATRIGEIIRKLGVPATEAAIDKLLTKNHKPVAAEAMAEMVRSGVIYVVDHNSQGKGRYWFVNEPVPVPTKNGTATG